MFLVLFPKYSFEKQSIIYNNDDLVWREIGQSRLNTSLV